MWKSAILELTHGELASLQRNAIAGFVSAVATFSFVPAVSSFAVVCVF